MSNDFSSVDSNLGSLATEASHLTPCAEPVQRRVAVLERCALAIAWLVFALGCVVQAGWIGAMAPLTSILPDQHATSPATALCWMLAALALVSTRQWKGNLGSFVAIALSWVVLLTGLSRLLSWLFQADFGLDAWVLRGNLDVRGGWPSTRMALNSALCFVLAGLALMALAAKGRALVSLAQALALCVMLVATLAVVGHSFQAPEFYGLNTDHPMPLPTALALMLLSIALMLAEPDRGLMSIITGDGPGGALARRLIPACVILPVAIGGGLFWASKHELLQAETAFGLSILSTIIVLLALIWGHASLIERAEARRRRAAAELQRSELFYHTLVETLPQNILRKDTTGRFTFANRLCSKTFGREQADLIGKTDLDLFPRPLAEKYRADDQRVMSERANLETVEEHIMPDGTTHYVHVIKTPLLDAKGKILGTQGIFWDVTETLLSEKRLREQNVLLQEMAQSERRAHQELKQTQARMVETAKLAGLGQMVAGVAHEINNPLAFVLNNIVVLERDLEGAFAVLRQVRELETSMHELAPEICLALSSLWLEADVDYTLSNLPGLLRRTREGLGRIQGIVKDLRVFARVEEDQFLEADIHQGIESTVHILMGNAKARGVAIELDLASIPRVFCQPAKLNQVIMNLVSNAIEASKEGGRVVVSTRPHPRGIAIEVLDEGFGIEPDVRDRIFDPFFTTKPIGEGTGLGLSISYGIVKEHGGTIDVSSQPGQGARFTVILPVHRSTDGQTGNQPMYPRERDMLAVGGRVEAPR